MELKFYNTRSKSKEVFTPINEQKVGVYCCGPTVYHYAHLGNLRSFLFEDILVRLLRKSYDVKHVMNITDVGHLSGDADDGEDKLEIGARREGKTVWDIAQMYTDAFFSDAQSLNIAKPDVIAHATQHIAQQLGMIDVLVQKGHTYSANGNVYFDTSTFKDYPKFANLQLNEQTKNRVDSDSAKKHPADFVLWFTRSKFENHAMQWESDYGKGYPGWHIECSAMAYHYLKGMMDIHCGGIDHIPVHHTNEIAQSECATGETFFHYWMHNEFLIDETGKMSKSKGDFLTISSLKQKGYDPLAYRFLCLQTHYRKQLTFSWDSLDNAQNALQKLRKKVVSLKSDISPITINSVFIEEFYAAMSDDMNTTKALSVLFEVLDSDLSNDEKYLHIIEFDSILGLGLSEYEEEETIITPELQQLLDERKYARENKDWAKSDELRDKIAELGYIVKDSQEGQVLERRK